MAIYPNGQASSGVYDIFHGTSFSPNDVVRGIKDNYSPINRTTMLNSLGYQVGLIQNFVNSSYLGRPEVPVQNAYISNAWSSGQFTVYSGSLTGNVKWASSKPDYFEAYETDGLNYFNSTCVEPSGVALTSTQTGYHTIELNRSGLYFSSYNSSLGGPSTLGLMVNSSYDGDYGGCKTWTRFEADGTDYFRMGNYSNPVDYSGVLELHGKRIDLTGARAINLQGYSELSNVNLWFCGRSLTISGGADSANVRIFNNLIPTTDGAKEIGDDAFAWGSGFINGVYSTILANGGTRYDTFVGGVCGAQVWNFSTQIVAGGIVTERAAAAPNKFLLSRISPSVTGFLQLNSDGQLEFFKIGSSGWVLTHF